MQYNADREIKKYTLIRRCEMFWRLVKIIPPLRNSEIRASGNKHSSKAPDDQIRDAQILSKK